MFIFTELFFDGLCASSLQVDLEELTQRMEQLTQEAESLAARGTLKDSIISTLASQIRAILRYGCPCHY